MISGQKMENLRSISGGPFFLEITIILGQKVGYFVCLVHQYFQWVKMALGSKRLDTLNLQHLSIYFKQKHSMWLPEVTSELYPYHVKIQGLNNF